MLAFIDTLWHWAMRAMSCRNCRQGRAGWPCQGLQQHQGIHQQGRVMMERKKESTKNPHLPQHNKALKKKKKSEVVESCYNLQNTQKTPAWSVCIIWIKVSNIQWIYKTNLKSKFQFFKFKELCRITACITVTRLSMYEVHSLYKNPGLMLKTSEITSGGVIGKGYSCRDYIFKLCKISLQKIYRKWRS